MDIKELTKEVAKHLSVDEDLSNEKVIECLTEYYNIHIKFYILKLKEALKRGEKHVIIYSVPESVADILSEMGYTVEPHSEDYSIVESVDKKCKEMKELVSEAVGELNSNLFMHNYYLSAWM